MGEQIETVRYTADVVVVNDLAQVLLVQRKYEPFAGMWALPGGHVDAGESGDAAARRELAEETGLALDASDLHFSCLADDPGRDPRGRYISAVFLAAVGRDVQPVAGDDAADAKFWSLDELPETAFDHAHIIELVTLAFAAALLHTL